MKLEQKQEISLPTAALGFAVNADASRLFVSCLDGSVLAVSAAEGKAEPMAQKHESFASGCVLSPDGQVLISAGYDGALIWHDVASRKMIRRVQAHDFWSWQMALSPDGKFIASVSGQYLAGGEKYEPAPEQEPSVKLFHAATGELAGALPHVPPVLSVAFSPDSKHLAAANMMGEVRLWDLASLGASPVKFASADFTSWGTTKSHHYCGGIYSLNFSPDGNSLLCCGMGPMTDPMAGNGKMIWQRWAWSENPPRKMDQIKDGENGSGLMECAAFTPSGQRFLMAGRMAQGTWNAALFDSSTGRLAASLDTKSRITRCRWIGEDTFWLSAATGQPARKEGRWDNFGRLFRCQVVG